MNEKKANVLNLSADEARRFWRRRVAIWVFVGLGGPMAMGFRRSLGWKYQEF